MDRFDGNSAALKIQQSKEDEYIRNQGCAEIMAEPIVLARMGLLDSDDISEALKGLTYDDYQSLAEDFGRGPMRDLAHGGSVVAEAIERYVKEQVMKELD